MIPIFKRKKNTRIEKEEFCIYVISEENQYNNLYEPVSISEGEIFFPVTILDRYIFSQRHEKTLF